MEESEPINSSPSKHAGSSSQARANKERSYECLDEAQSIKTEGLIDHLRRNYTNYLIVLVAVLLMLIVMEVCFNSYLTIKRESIFERNMKLLREYKQWDQRTQNVEKKEK